MSVLLLMEQFKCHQGGCLWYNPDSKVHRTLQAVTPNEIWQCRLKTKASGKSVDAGIPVYYSTYYDIITDSQIIVICDRAGDMVFKFNYEEWSRKYGEHRGTTAPTYGSSTQQSPLGSGGTPPFTPAEARRQAELARFAAQLTAQQNANPYQSPLGQLGGIGSQHPMTATQQAQQQALAQSAMALQNYAAAQAQRNASAPTLAGMHSLPVEKSKFGELIGKRCWIVMHKPSSGYYLHSLFGRDMLWSHWTPMEGDVYSYVGGTGGILGGVHAFKDMGNTIAEYNPMNMAQSLLNRRDENTNPIGLVYGDVEMWGDVIEHERGYRAQFARVKWLKLFYAVYARTAPENEIMAALRHKYCREFRAIPWALLKSRGIQYHIDQLLDRNVGQSTQINLVPPRHMSTVSVNPNTISIETTEMKVISLRADWRRSHWEIYPINKPHAEFLEREFGDFDEDNY